MVMGIPYQYFKGYLNCYIGCNHLDDEKDRIYVAFRLEDLESRYYEYPKGRLKNSDRISVIKNHKQFVKEIKLDDFVLYSFRVLDNFKVDFELFKKGKYSQFSLRYKKIITNMYPNTKRIHSVINPSEKDRKKLSKDLLLKNVLPKGTEIYSRPEEIEESFSISHFIKVEV
jgi:hypothetical protein